MNHPPRMVLGQQVDFSPAYDPTQLCPVLRRLGREAAGISLCPSFAHGEDIWNMYELSWLQASGKPVVAMAEIRVPWDTPCLIESKSLKLYCNSFNMTAFSDSHAVTATMSRDLSHAAGGAVTVSIIPADRFAEAGLLEAQGRCLDDVHLETVVYEPAPDLLTTAGEEVREQVFTRLFRSRCPVTAQPDWATVSISYAGPRIDPAGLLGYLVSFREHQGFHEACVERIHADISRRCCPRELEVSARFTRRGGLDINPVRSTRPGPWPNQRDPRQ